MWKREKRLSAVLAWLFPGCWQGTCPSALGVHLKWTLSPDVRKGQVWFNFFQRRGIEEFLLSLCPAPLYRYPVWLRFTLLSTKRPTHEASPSPFGVLHLHGPRVNAVSKLSPYLQFLLKLRQMHNFLDCLSATSFMKLFLLFSH